MNLLLFLMIGALAGWLAGVIMKGKGFGWLGNLVVGILGGLMGGFLFGLLGVGGEGIVGSLASALIGAIVLLWIINLIKK